MLKDILSISGKPGLFKMISNATKAMVVESLLDGKRFPVYSSTKVIGLEDISIFTENEEMPLKTVFKRIFDKENGGTCISHKASGPEIMNYIETIIPEYDRERVYQSDMKKIVQWYNLLQEKQMLHFEEETPEKETPEEGEKEEELEK